MSVLNNIANKVALLHSILFSLTQAGKCQNNGGTWMCAYNKVGGVFQDFASCYYCEKYMTGYYCDQNHESCTMPDVDCRIGYAVRTDYTNPVSVPHDPADTSVKVAGLYADYITDTNPTP